MSTSLNKTSIDWTNPREGWSLDYTWNPVYGCTRGCPYCYANRIHTVRQKAKARGKKLPEQYKYPFSVLQFFPSRLTAFDKLMRMSTIFVGDMADIAFHTPENIRKVIAACARNPHHRFLFLTKSYTFYREYDFPTNCWFGITMVSGKNVLTRGYEDFVALDWPQKFISIEPLRGDFEGVDLTWAQWVIVGKRSGAGSFNELIPRRYITSIVHPNVYWKKSIQPYVDNNNHE